MDFDAIVIGSGISGGWAAKELCERGMRTLLIERGRHVTHKTDYQDFAAPWELAHRGQVPEDEARRDYAIQSTCYAFNSATRQWWVKDSEHPYLTPEGREFLWLRGYHLGGRSLTWARQTYRFSDIDFGANSKDGHGVDWPIRYCRHFAVVRPRRNLRRHFRQQRRTRAVARRPFPEADGSQLRRARFQAQAREQPSVAPRHDRPLRASDRAHRRTHRARARALPAAKRV